MGDIAKRVRDRRRECGLTASETARRAHISRPYLSKIENAEFDVAMSGEVLHRLSKVLNADPVWILGLDTEEDPAPLPPKVEDVVAARPTDARLVAMAALIEFQADRRELTRDDWIVVTRALLDPMFGRAQTQIQRRAQARLARQLVDRALSEDARERSLRLVEKLIGLLSLLIPQEADEQTEDEKIDEEVDP